MRQRELLALGIALLCGVERATAQDGSVDGSFGPTGVLTPVVGEEMAAAAIFRTHRFVVVGDVGSSAQSIASETVEAFDDHLEISECAEVVPFMASFAGKSVLVDRGDRAMIAGTLTFIGSESQDRAIVARYQTGDSCLLDPQWSSNGWLVLDDRSFCDTEDCSMIALADAPTESSRIFGLLEAQVNSLVSRYFVVAFAATGEVDASFGSTGYAEVTASGLGSLAAGKAFLAVDRLGRPIVFAGRYDPAVAFDLDTFLQRFTAAGQPDASLGTGGILVIDNTPTSDVLPGALLVEPDGAIVTATIDLTASPDNSTLLRLPAAGGVTTRFLAGLAVRSLAWQGDHKLLVASDLTGGDGMMVQRFLWPPTESPSLDVTFGNSGGLVLDFDYGGANNEDPVTLLLSAGRVLVTANADAGPSSRGFAATRLLNAYLFADGFELGNLVRWSEPN
jgi:hypothetical protein